MAAGGACGLMNEGQFVSASLAKVFTALPLVIVTRTCCIFFSPRQHTARAAGLPLPAAVLAALSSNAEALAWADTRTVPQQTPEV